VVLNRIAVGTLAFLRSFVLAISLILAMASSVLWHAILT
jgi:predicted RND superfamily exporter protein